MGGSELAFFERCCPCGKKTQEKKRINAEAKSRLGFDARNFLGTFRESGRRMKDAPAVEIEKKREIRFFLQPVKTGKSRCYSSILETSVEGVRENPNSSVGFIGSYPTDTGVR